jgi:hypothetical protein
VVLSAVSLSQSLLCLLGPGHIHRLGLVAQCIAVGALATLSARALITLEPVLAYLSAANPPLPAESQLAQLVDWAAQASGTLRVVHLALSRRRNCGVEELQLDVLEFAFVIPLCRAVRRGVVRIVVWAYFMASALCFTLDPPSSLFCSCVRLCCILYMLACTSALLLHPLRCVCGALHCSVRDENYLVGRRLVNLSEQQAAGTAGTAAA